MIRAAVVLILLVAAVVGGLTLAGEPGEASVTWLGWRADMTAAAAILIALTFGLFVAMVWRTILWILEAPHRAERARADARRRQANDILYRILFASVRQNFWRVACRHQVPGPSQCLRWRLYQQFQEPFVRISPSYPPQQACS